jgi:hypothetical protein
VSRLRSTEAAAVEQLGGALPTQESFYDPAGDEITLHEVERITN